MKFRSDSLIAGTKKSCLTLAVASMFFASGAFGMVVLDDQTTTCTPGSIASTQSLDSPGFDSEAADDILVPAGQPWLIKQVFASGSYFDVKAQSVNITFFADASGVPGDPVDGCAYNGITTFTDASGLLTIDLPTQCALQGGSLGTTYWLGVQPVTGTGAAFGIWYWSENSVQHGDVAQWENPNGGFHQGCATWGDRTTCAQDTDPDQCFSVSGDIDTIFANGFEGS
jgi:hypothetical protein